jgi:predicted nucleotidyltransferase
MKILTEYDPLLIGSVWRGTIHKESDIDIILHHDEPEEILQVLQRNNLQIIQAEWVLVTKNGKRKGAFHIHTGSSNDEKAEIKVVDSEEPSCGEKCEIYGDTITGLRTAELEKLLQENPTQRFVPF